MKQKYLICTIIIVILLIEIYFLSKSNVILYINWGIYLPTPSSEKTVYEHNLAEGENFYIWSYSAKKSNKFSKKLKQLDSDNIEELTKNMENYYNRLDSAEKTLYWNNVSWSNLNFNYLLNFNNNYYYYKVKDNDNDILLIMTDVENKKLYIFESYY